MTTIDVGDLVGELVPVYEDLHAHPELSFAEHRTAGIAAERLRSLGFEVADGVGRTGVVATLENGPGPCVLLRADMDALPVAEETGLAYASRVRVTDHGGHDVGVAHACGHDMHVTWLLGAAAELVRTRGAWSGRLLLVVQPAEEVGAGAQTMVDDDLFGRFGRPDVCLGQHVAPAPAGMVLHRSGPVMAGADSLHIRLRGRGGHGASPELAVDPVVMAASTVLRLQTVVSRNVAATEAAVVTVGTIHAGTKENIIADDAELTLSVRTFRPHVREQVMAAIERIVHGEAHAAGADHEPEITVTGSFPPLVNSEEATATVAGAFGEHFGDRVMPLPLVTASEDFGAFAAAAGCPSVFWFVGGTDADLWTRAFAENRLAQDVPWNHSPRFAPVQHPTIETGIEALVVAARCWLEGDG